MYRCVMRWGIIRPSSKKANPPRGGGAKLRTSEERGSRAAEGRATMSKAQGEGCRHLIADVALRTIESGYMVKCHGCASPLGVVATPREVQALRRVSPRTRLISANFRE